ncbi:MAG TPA: hypothetical protein PLO33_04925 [Kouleothrix sp.]|uniref:hypothetical protein n=1 Tax=Kouleothrix sp. TaxID=2779161 RepID=UPI002C13CF5B|nr:hypothetical protein [Kouleothrix sp.]HRC74999.1 hypothetical protein [Kouleothrix sp.]
MLEYFQETAADDAGGQAADGLGKLALVPHWRNHSPLAQTICREARGAACGEQQLLEHIVGVIRSGGCDLPRALIVNYYVSLKTNPFVILTGVAGQGKTELARLFAEALVGRDSPQYQCISGAGSWANATGKDRYYRTLQEHFSSWRFIELLQEAAAPNNFGKAYMVCFDALHPADLDYYFEMLLQVTPNGAKRLNLPGFPADCQPVIPPNVYITATVDTAEYRQTVSREVLRHAGLIEFRAPQRPAEPALQLVSAPPVPPTGYQRLWLRAAQHDVRRARARINSILGAEQTARLHYSPALARLFWRGGQALTKDTLDELTTYIANSFDEQGNGLFDPVDPLRNAQIAYDAQVIQRALWRLHDAADDELRRDLASYLDAIALSTTQQAVA